MEKTVIIFYMCAYAPTVTLNKPGKNTLTGIGRGIGNPAGIGTAGIIGAVSCALTPPTVALVNRAHGVGMMSEAFGNPTTILKNPKTILVVTGEATAV